MISQLNKLLEQTLLQKGIINAEQLEFVKAHQASQQISFAEGLVENGVLKKSELASIIENLYDIRSIKIEEIEIDNEAVKHVPSALAFKYNFIPFRRSGNALAIAFADITNMKAFEELKKVTDLEIIPFEARFDAIEHAQFIYYGDSENISENGLQEKVANYTYRSSLLSASEKYNNLGKSLLISEKFSFDSVVVSDENQFAVELCKSVAEKPEDQSYNPLLIWGNSGLGKTHLLHATANHLTIHFPLKKIIFTNSTLFLDGLYDCIKENKENLFRFIYSDTDYLICDDFDKLLKYDWAQQEAACIINLLRSKKKQVILASKLQINLNQCLNHKLKEEIEFGVMAQVIDFSNDMCLRVLNHAVQNVDISQDILQHLINLYQGNTSEMLDIVKQLTVLTHNKEQSCTRELVDSVVNLSCPTVK